ncbi:DUF305 domain-containing protein [Salinadaptatus halalkaliphilus]|uniref:DUF305 domain-containing protein n=1 Tax=Salinadaptatus halalkaliphilus TaxID=2419781 RepID=A0A4S3TQR3_9EURY|nr:DUF305 domain-containing protein [Salinadaptatus halalkaliphilus]THE66749.1 DUF305 domain-containing protein [Salinadaptatus halalkaliphilus]
MLCATGAASTAGFAGYVTAGTQENENEDEDTEFNVVDIMFVRMMIPHHEGAIQMAELIPERTDREELLDLRTEIIEEQEAEIDLMCELLNDANVAGCDEVGSMMPHEMGEIMRGGGMHDNGEMHGDDMGDGMQDGDDMSDGMGPDEMEEMMPREHMMTHDDRRELRRAENEEFDCLFAEHMIRHHEGAVAMSEHVLDEVESERVSDLADDIIDAQQEEIELMEEWRDDWDC